MDYSENYATNPSSLNKLRLVPKCYKEVGKILKEVKACKGNIKTVLYKTRHKGAFFNKIYSLAANVLKHKRILERVIKDTNLLDKEKFIPEGLAEILVYEIIFSKGPPGESRPVVAVKNHEQSILNAYAKIKDDITLLPKDLKSLPQYVRVNKLHTSVSDVLKDLEKSYFQILYKENIPENEYLELVRNLEPGQFLIDYHFKDLIVFSSKEKIYNWPLYEQGHVYIQDKSSCIPVRALNPKPGSTVVDACAAPGNKTVHMASIMKNKGVIHAFERDEGRFTTLKDNLALANVQICTPKCKDFFLVDTADDKYQSVEYVLVDPSCSGSGMVSRMDEVTDSEDSKTADRLESLAKFQIKMLKHALRFPNARRVVYSTCSVHEQENERVVHEVLAQFAHAYRLAPVLPEWSVRGSGDYEYGHLCARASPDVTLTNGFFVAMFERLGDDDPRPVSTTGSGFMSLECSGDGGPEIGRENLEERCSVEASVDGFSNGGLSKHSNKKQKKRQKIEDGETSLGDCEARAHEGMQELESSKFSEDSNGDSSKRLKKRKRKDKHDNEEISLGHCKDVTNETMHENLLKSTSYNYPEDFSNVELSKLSNKKKHKKREKIENGETSLGNCEEETLERIHENLHDLESNKCSEKESNEESSKRLNKKHKRKDKSENEETSLDHCDNESHKNIQENLLELGSNKCSEKESNEETYNRSNKKRKRKDKNKKEETSLEQCENVMHENLLKPKLYSSPENLSRLEEEKCSNDDSNKRSSKNKHKRKDKNRIDEASLEHFEDEAYERKHEYQLEQKSNGCSEEVSTLEDENCSNKDSSKLKKKHKRKDKSEDVTLGIMNENLPKKESNGSHENVSIFEKQFSNDDTSKHSSKKKRKRKEVTENEGHGEVVETYERMQENPQESNRCLEKISGIEEERFSNVESSDRSKKHKRRKIHINTT